MISTFPMSNQYNMLANHPSLHQPDNPAPIHSQENLAPTNYSNYNMLIKPTGSPNGPASSGRGIPLNLNVANSSNYTNYTNYSNSGNSANSEDSINSASSVSINSINPATSLSSKSISAGSGSKSFSGASRSASVSSAVDGSNPAYGSSYKATSWPTIEPSGVNFQASPSVEATPPMKKKRGRPPKATSLSTKITTTVNINVNTSPLRASPMAETSSNQVMMRGAPDIFTPLMRVSPSSRTKRKRKNSTSSSLGSSPVVTKTLKLSVSLNSLKLTSNNNSSMNNNNSSNSSNVLVTPLSTAINGSTFTPYHQINSKTLDNMSMITQLDPNTGATSTGSSVGLILQTGSGAVPFYNTPPSSTVKSQFPNYLNTPNFDLPRTGYPTPSSELKNSVLMQNPYMVLPDSTPTPGSDEQHVSPINKNLLPPVSLVSASSNALGKAQISGNGPISTNGGTSHKSSLSKIKEEIKEQGPDQQQLHGFHLEQQQQHISNSDIRNSVSSSNSGDFLLKLTIDDLGKAVLSSDFFTSSFELNALETTEESFNKIKSSRRREPKLVNQQKHKKVDNSEDEDSKPRLTHVNSVIGIEGQYLPQNQVGGLTPPFGLDSNDLNQNQNQTLMSGRPNLLRRHNSDFTGVAASSILGTHPAATNVLSSINENGNSLSVPSVGIQLPQTPNYKENYLYSSTGLTPNSNLTFNLTPQFNSMMYSMMGVNSPQQKKGLNNSISTNNNHSNNQFLLAQEFFMNGSHSETTLMDSNSQQQPSFAQGQLQQQHEQYGIHLQSDSINVGDLIDVSRSNELNSKLPLAESRSSGMSSGSSSNAEDSEDARLALKKVIHVKRR